MGTNKERQADEIEAISSICDDEEFLKLSSDQAYEMALKVSPIIEKGVLDIRYSNVILKHRPTPKYRHFSVKNLPPVCLRINLPADYPEIEPPRYQLDISWLPPWECSLVCLRLDELWEENKGSEILFVWRDFLQNEILDILNYKESLDVSFLFALYDEPNDHVTIGLLKLADERARNDALFLHPMRYLTSYDESRKIIDFSKTFHTCGICFEEYPGHKCTEFRDCGHVFCKICTAEYFASKINEGNGARMLCPNLNCYSLAQSQQIRDICPDLNRKYEESVLVFALKSMNDVVFCPRISCQSPVITEPGENLATCNQCKYNFCLYCRRVYHGVEPCPMTSAENTELVRAYVKANNAKKRQLLKKYGRRQIQLVVEEQLSKEYLKVGGGVHGHTKEKTKPCPECQTPTEKIHGCNKMLCAHCRTNFCWLCGLRISSANAYDHFTTISEENTCYGGLFEGMLEMTNEIPDDDD